MWGIAWVWVSLFLIFMQPAVARSKDQGKWETIYHWCANEAPEYLFDASFDEWMDACISDRGKKKVRK